METVNIWVNTTDLASPLELFKFMVETKIITLM